MWLRSSFAVVRRWLARWCPVHCWAHFKVIAMLIFSRLITVEGDRFCCDRVRSRVPRCRCGRQPLYPSLCLPALAPENRTGPQSVRVFACAAVNCVLLLFWSFISQCKHARAAVTIHLDDTPNFVRRAACVASKSAVG